MRLLLTSGGLSHPEIVSALEQLVGATLSGKRIAYIPTASNVEPDDKQWLVESYQQCLATGAQLDIVDISALPKADWSPRLAAADVIYVGGGNSIYLMLAMKRSGFVKALPTLMESRVYVGESAGSCVTARTIVNPVQDLYHETWRETTQEGLGLVDFQFLPHFGSPIASEVTEDNVATAMTKMSEPAYLCDDQTAVYFSGKDLHVVGPGRWQRFDGLAPTAK